MPPKSFKPPRPSSAIKKTTTSKPSKSASKNKSTASTTSRKAGASKSTPKTTSKTKAKAKATLPQRSSPSENDEEDPFSEPIEVDSEPIQEDAEEEDDEEKATIPPELLTRLLHDFFQKEGTRISKDANAAIGKYMDVFVRESLARVVWAKAEDVDRVDDGFCEVEDLEKLAPQILLDF